MKKLWIVPVLLSAAIICSCSVVEENRDNCPCWYTIDLTEVDRSMQNLHLWIFDEEGMLICRDSLHKGAYGEYEVKLGRGKAYCYVWGNIMASTILSGKSSPDSFFTKADSCSSDPLFHYSKVLDTDAEVGRDTVILQKEYANVEFTVKGNIEYKEQLQIEIQMQECARYVNGTLMAYEGSVYATPQIIGSDYSVFKFRIMRQGSIDGIIARITAVNDGARIIVKEFPFGEWLALSGYDMSAKNLADIKMELDMAIGILSIKSEGWNSVLPVKIQI